MVRGVSSPERGDGRGPCPAGMWCLVWVSLSIRACCCCCFLRQLNASSTAFAFAQASASVFFVVKIFTIEENHLCSVYSFCRDNKLRRRRRGPNNNSTNTKPPGRREPPHTRGERRRTAGRQPNCLVKNLVEASPGFFFFSRPIIISTSAHRKP